MDGDGALLDLLIRATAIAGRPEAGTSRGELAELARAVPSDALPAAAALHRVSGTVRRGLGGVDGVAQSALDGLDAQRGESALHHLLAVGSLGQIGRRFDAAGLRWAVMKGPVVAALLYPDVGDRSYADLDLLVARTDFPHATAILEELGYRHAIHDWALAERVLAGQIGFSSAALDVDLHWHLHFSRDDRRPFAIRPDAMLERTRRVVVSGTTVPTLDPIDTVITLAFHAARSGGHRLVWLKDVERAVAVDRPDLDELVDRCRTSRCAPPVGLVLDRARRVLDADIPSGVVDATTPAVLRAADRAVCAAVRPVRLHERDTVPRWLIRSARSSSLATVSALPARGVRALRQLARPTTYNESDSPAEKANYLRAVSTSTEP